MAKFEVQELEVTLIGETQKICLGAGTIFDGKAVLREQYDVGVLLNSCDRGYGIFNFDDQTVYFLEKYLSDIHNDSNVGQSDDQASAKKFTRTHLLVAIDTLFKMMENGLYPLSKLQVILLHLL